MSAPKYKFILKLILIYPILKLNEVNCRFISKYCKQVRFLISVDIAIRPLFVIGVSLFISFFKLYVDIHPN